MKVKLIILLFLIAVISCKNEKSSANFINENKVTERTAVKSFKLNRASSELDKLNKMNLAKIEDSILSKQLTEIGQKFKNNTYDIYHDLIKISGGFVRNKVGHLTNELVAPNDKKIVTKFMINEGNQNNLNELINTHQFETKNSLYKNDSFRKYFNEVEFEKKYNELRIFSNTYYGLTVAETLLKLSKLMHAEKKLIQSIIKDAVEQKR